MNFCNEHPSFHITFICIASHNCKRKLCSKCLEEHRLDGKYTYLLNTFNQQIQKKLQQFKLNDSSQQNQIKVGFKSAFDKIDMMISLMEKVYNVKPDDNSSQQKVKENFKTQLKKFENTMSQKKIDLDEKLNCCFNLLNEDDQFYLSLKERTDANLSNSQLNKLANILNADGLQKWQLFSKSIYKQLEQERIKIDLQVEEFQKVNFVQSIKLKQELELKNLQYIPQTKYEQKYLIWNQVSFRFLFAQFFIIKTNNMNIQYIIDGKIIRSDQIKDRYDQFEFFVNLEQIKNLNWLGKQCQNDRSSRRWKALWKGDNLDTVGGEYLDGINKDNGKKLHKIIGGRSLTIYLLFESFIYLLIYHILHKGNSV